MIISQKWNRHNNVLVHYSRMMILELRILQLSRTPNRPMLWQKIVDLTLFWGGVCFHVLVKGRSMNKALLAFSAFKLLHPRMCRDMGCQVRVDRKRFPWKKVLSRACDMLHVWYGLDINQTAWGGIDSSSYMIIRGKMESSTLFYLELYHPLWHIFPPFYVVKLSKAVTDHSVNQLLRS